MAEEPQVGLRNEDVERKRKYYHIIFSERRGQENSDATLQEHSLLQVRTS